MYRKLYEAAALFLAVIMLLSVTACSMKLSVDDSESDSVSEQAAVSSERETGSTKAAYVEIIQYMDHTGLNECCNGIKACLDKSGIKYSVTVGSGSAENAVSECEKKAREIATNGSCSLVIAIGTPCAEVVCPTVTTSGRIPSVFCAVSDPVGAGIVSDIISPGINCTGVTAALSAEDQLDLVYNMQPFVTDIGVLYSDSEQNAVSQLSALKEAAKKKNIAIADESVDDPSELSEKASSLMKRVQAVIILPDNMIAKNSWSITERSIVEGVPVYGVTLTQVSEGCLAGYCYDFTAAGEQAGEQAVQILHGESAAQVPIINKQGYSLYINTDRLNDFGMMIPDGYKGRAAEVSTSYEQ